jgi:hypothetical protein
MTAGYLRPVLSQKLRYLGTEQLGIFGRSVCDEAVHCGPFVGG